MLTLEKLTAAAQELPAEFSLGQLVDKLLAANESVPTATSYAEQPAANQGDSVSPIESIFGIAAGLSEADRQKSAKEWEAERIREKYGV